MLDPPPPLPTIAEHWTAAGIGSRATFDRHRLRAARQPSAMPTEAIGSPGKGEQSTAMAIGGIE
jgi:hypothetical protein